MTLQTSIFPAIAKHQAPMNHAVLIFITITLFAVSVHAQERIYRCGNEYTNATPGPQTQGCKLVEGGNVTVIQGTTPTPPALRSAVATGAAPANAPKVDSKAQKSRDSDARRILEDELKKAEARQAELLKSYSNGEPEKIGSETRNHQKYLDRVAEIKASLDRNESDLAGIRRELGRLAPATTANSAAN